MPRPSTRLVLLSLFTGSSYGSAASAAPVAHDSTAAYVSYVPVTASFAPFSRVGKAVRRAIPGTRANRQGRGGCACVRVGVMVRCWPDACCLWSTGWKRKSVVNERRMLTFCPLQDQVCGELCWHRLYAFLTNPFQCSVRYLCQQPQGVGRKYRTESDLPRAMRALHPCVCIRSIQRPCSIRRFTSLQNPSS